jgi:hypothetical protein
MVELRRIPAIEMDVRSKGVQLISEHGHQQVEIGVGTSGNRVNRLPRDKADEEVVIPGGELSAKSEGVLARGIPD